MCTQTSPFSTGSSGVFPISKQLRGSKLETLFSWILLIFGFRSINTFLSGAKLSNFWGNILFGCCRWKDGLASRLASETNKRTEMPENRSPCICCIEKGKHILGCGGISSTFPVGWLVTPSDSHSWNRLWAVIEC